MKNILLTIVLSIMLVNFISNAQDITNTLAPNGKLIVKDSTTNFLSLSQTTGNLTLFKNLDLNGLETDTTTTVIRLNGQRFIHNYKGTGTYGFNTFLGLNAGNFTMGGSYSQASYNTGVGYRSLYSLTTGLANSAFGYNSLSSNTTGIRNSAFGHQSLYYNTTGNDNSAFGISSLYSNTTGNSNSAFGISSLYSNTTGNNNTANGFFALYSNTTGNNNTANGFYALYSNTTGRENTAVGYKSLFSNVSGFQNTAVGDSALYKNTGNYNTAIGYNAGSQVTTGANLTLIGIDANPSSPTAIDQITLGNQFVTSLRCNVQTITSLSDVRDKKNIKDLSLGLDFITKLKPREFNWDRRDWYEGGISDGSKMKKEPTAGFIAQELDELQNEEHAEWLNLVLKDNPEKWEATPGNLFPVMVKAIQELKAEKDNEISELKIQNEKLSEELHSEKIKNANEIRKLTEDNLKLQSELKSLSSIKEDISRFESLKEELIQQINELKSIRKEYENKYSSIDNERRLK